MYEVLLFYNFKRILTKAVLKICVFEKLFKIKAISIYLFIFSVLSTEEQPYLMKISHIYEVGKNSYVVQVGTFILHLHKIICITIYMDMIINILVKFIQFNKVIFKRINLHSPTHSIDE